MLERLTFFLAFAGYAGLTTTAVAAAHSRLPVVLWRTTMSVIVLHVFLVWTVRYDWQLSAAVRNGYVGFVVFHGALAMIVASVFMADRNASRLVFTAFVVVTLGAIGAVFRYEVVALYRIPVILIAVIGAIGLARASRRNYQVTAA